MIAIDSMWVLARLYVSAMRVDVVQKQRVSNSLSRIMNRGAGSLGDTRAIKRSLAQTLIRNVGASRCVFTEVLLLAHSHMAFIIRCYSHADYMHQILPMVLTREAALLVRAR